MLLEELTRAHGKRQTAAMQRLGYRPSRQIGCNRFYCRYGTDAARLESASVSTHLVRLPHPIDARAAGSPGTD